MLQKIFNKLVEICANGAKDTDALEDIANNTALSMDCLCNPECPVPGVLNAAGTEVTVDGETPLTEGQTIALYDAENNPVGTAVVDGPGVYDADTDKTVYPITNSTVATADIATVATVKPVLQQAAKAVDSIAIKKLALATPIKEETPVRG